MNIMVASYKHWIIEPNIQHVMRNAAENEAPANVPMSMPGMTMGAITFTSFAMKQKRTKDATTDSHNVK